MATFTLESGPVSVGAQFKSVGTMLMDSSYPTGGESLTASQLGLQSVEEAHAEVVAISGTINVANAVYDKTNSKVKVFDETPAEVGNTNSLENVKIQITAYGKARAK